MWRRREARFEPESRSVGPATARSLSDAKTPQRLLRRRRGGSPIVRRAAAAGCFDRSGREVYWTAMRRPSPRELVPLGLGIVTLLVFMPTLRNGFVWDDVPNLLANPHYRGLGWTQVRWMATAIHLGHYIPLTWLSLAIDYVLWGMNPVGYHLSNVVLHAA